MNEDDYLKATNRVKISAALTLVRDVLPGYKWGITDEEHQKIVSLLREAEINLFKSFQIDNENDNLQQTLKDKGFIPSFILLKRKPKLDFINKHLGYN